MDPHEVLDEGFLRRYRELLDAEEQAFDELEHAYEDGDRIQFAADLEAFWQVLDRKRQFLEQSRLPAPPVDPAMV